MKTTTTPHHKTEAEQRLAEAIRETMTPHAVALIVNKCRLHFAENELGLEIEGEVRWFTKILMDMLGVDEFNRLSEEMSL